MLLSNLEWDGENRIDSLLIDYFGADNNIYSQEAIRKMLVGAVARIFKPGAKFDLVLTLVGDQGTGKSTFIKKLGKEWVESGRVFTQRNGKPMHVNSYYTWLRKFATKHNLKKAGPQCLRHTSATHKLYLGVPAKDVQDDLGHTSIRTTNRYMHKLHSTSKESSDMMTKHLQRLRAKDQDGTKEE